MVLFPALTVFILFTCATAQVFRAPDGARRVYTVAQTFAVPTTQTRQQNQDFSAPNTQTRQQNQDFSAPNPQTRLQNQDFSAPNPQTRQQNQFTTPTNALNTDRRNNDAPVSLQAPVAAQTVARVPERVVGSEQQVEERERALRQQITELLERERSLRQQLQQEREQSERRERVGRPEQEQRVTEERRERVRGPEQERVLPERVSGPEQERVPPVRPRQDDVPAQVQPPQTPRPTPAPDNAVCNPLTGFRAQRGGPYAWLLQRLGGVQAGNCGQSNSRLVQAVNSRGGLLAVGDQNSAMPSQQSTESIPGLAIAAIVVACVVAVVLMAVVVQLSLLLRRS